MTSRTLQLGSNFEERTTTDRTDRLNGTGFRFWRAGDGKVGVHQNFSTGVIAAGDFVGHDNSSQLKTNPHARGETHSKTLACFPAEFHASIISAGYSPS